MDFWKETCFHQKKREKNKEGGKRSQHFPLQERKNIKGKEEVKVRIAPLLTCQFLLLFKFDGAEILNLLFTFVFKAYIILLFLYSCVCF